MKKDTTKKRINLICVFSKANLEKKLRLGTIIDVKRLDPFKNFKGLIVGKKTTKTNNE